MANILSKFILNTIEELSKIGVYSIHHSSKPNRKYIGSTSKYKSSRAFYHHGFYKRFYDHYRQLLLNQHHSKFLQNTINKYGIEGLVFNIIEICDNQSIKDIREREQYWINKMKPVYNSFSTIFPKGRIWTQKEKIEQSNRLKGTPLSIKAYEKIYKIIYQFSRNGEFIREWKSKAEASKTLKIDPASISNCAYGRRKTAGNFQWKWSKNYIYQNHD